MVKLLHGDHNWKTLKILAVDPGETVGFAIQTGSNIAHGQAPVHDFMKDVFTTMRDYPAERYDAIACELFKVRPRVPPSYETMEAIGGLKYLAEWYGIPFEGYIPAQTKRVSDERLKKEGLWTTNKRHANDAARVLYLYRCGV